MDNIDCDNYDDMPKVFSEPHQPVKKEQKDLIHLTDIKPNCKESLDSRIQIIRKIMEELLEDDIDDTFKDVFSAVTNTFDNYEYIDKEMVKKLKSIFSNDLVKKQQFADIIKAINQGSTVVYFKSAQLFKVYKKTELETVLRPQIRTIFKQLDESYEVIPNESKQKIIILGDISLEDNIERIKKYIVSFMIGEGILNFTNNDLVCYKSKEYIEIIINNYYVENRTENDEIVKKLLKYIFQQENNTKIVQKINTNPFSEFDGVKMVYMPSEKKLLATEYIEPLLTMISNVTECIGFKYNINVNSVNHNITDNSVHLSNSDFIEQFIVNIKTNKPQWFKFGERIAKKILLENYEKLYGKAPYGFYKLIKNRLYTGSDIAVRVNNTRIKMVMLYKIDNLILKKSNDNTSQSNDNTSQSNDNTSQSNDNTLQSNDIIITNKKVHIGADSDWNTQLQKNLKRNSKWVYFIQDGTGVKIGLTINLKDRINTLQTGNPCRLKLIAYIETENMHLLEKHFHNHLKSLLLLGEWFKLDKEKIFKMLEGYRNNKIIYDF